MNDRVSDIVAPVKLYGPKAFSAPQWRALARLALGPVTEWDRGVIRVVTLDSLVTLGVVTGVFTSDGHIWTLAPGVKLPAAHILEKHTSKK